MFCDGFNSSIIGECRKEEYIKSGRSWKLVETETEPITPANYCNGVDAIPFFRNLGGREIVSMGYTKLGYIPTESNSISPDREKKIIRKYRFN